MPAAAVICLLPRIGVLPAEAFQQVNLRTCFYIAALLATKYNTGQPATWAEAFAPHELHVAQIR